MLTPNSLLQSSVRREQRIYCCVYNQWENSVTQWREIKSKKNNKTVDLRAPWTRVAFAKRFNVDKYGRVCNGCAGAHVCFREWSFVRPSSAGTQTITDSRQTNVDHGLPLTQLNTRRPRRSKTTAYCQFPAKEEKKKSLNKSYDVQWSMRRVCCSRVTRSIISYGGFAIMYVSHVPSTPYV